MPAATYRRQLRLWREAEERLDALANARLGGLLPALAGLLRETAGASLCPSRPARAAESPASGRCPGWRLQAPHSSSSWSGTGGHGGGG